MHDHSDHGPDWWWVGCVEHRVLLPAAEAMPAFDACQPPVVLRLAHVPHRFRLRMDDPTAPERRSGPDPFRRSFGRAARPRDAAAVDLELELVPWSERACALELRPHHRVLIPRTSSMGLLYREVAAALLSSLAVDMEMWARLGRAAVPAASRR